MKKIFFKPGTSEGELNRVVEDGHFISEKGEPSQVECPPGTAFNDLLTVEALVSKITSQFPDRKPCPVNWHFLAWKMSFVPLENQSSLWYLQYRLTVQ